jgi:hypothetical protein
MARKDHKPDGRRFNGGKRQGAGRPPGPTGGPKWRTLRDLAGTYTEEAIETLRSMMRNSKDDWLRLACANALLDRGHGKPREAAIFEQQETLTARYQSLDEIKAELIANGLPIDHLEHPKLIELKPSEK